MARYAVVPVKSLGDSKRRLSEVFTPQERKMLTLAMLEDVLVALKNSLIEKVLVVGEDRKVREISENHGTEYLATSKTDLNAAIEEANDLCVKQGAASVLVLPADVPLISVEDINRLVELAGKDQAVVLSPSANWGTNALYQSPPKLIPACFGPNSFLAHVREAYIRGISVRLHFSTGLATDIDAAEDLRKLFQSENNTECKRILKRIAHESANAGDFIIRKNSYEKLGKN